MSITHRTPQTLVTLGDGDVMTCIADLGERGALYSFTPLPDRDRGEPGSSAEHLADAFSMEHASVMLHYKDEAAVDRTIADLQKLRQLIVEAKAKAGEA